MSQSGPDKKIANTLVALSSAAVLAVYTAGFFKTKTAADRLEALESRVRPGMAASRGEAPPSNPGEPLARPALARATPDRADAAPAAIAKAPAAAALAKADTSAVSPPPSSPPAV